jgi:prophage tail gpP-like protein
MVVSSDRDSAEKIKLTLQHFGIDEENWLLGEKGFTNEVRSGSIEAFSGK